MTTRLSYASLRGALALLLALLLTATGFVVARRVAGKDNAQLLATAVDLIRSDTAQTTCSALNDCVDPTSRYFLFVFFSPRDCPICLYETSILDSLYREFRRDDLEIIGVMQEASREEARRFAYASTISYALYTHPRRLDKYIENPRPTPFNKPMTVLFSRSGAVLETAVAGLTVQSHWDLVARIRNRVRGDDP